MRTRSGVALALALLVLVAIEALTVGALVLVTQETLIADTRARSAEARAAAEVAVRELIRDWPATGVESLHVGSTISHRDSIESVTLTIERLAPARYLVMAQALSGHARAQVRAYATALIRTLAADLLAAEFDQAVSSYGLLLLGAHATVDAGLAEADSCERFAGARTAARVPDEQTIVVGPDAAVLGAIVIDSTISQTDTAIALGGVRWSELPDIADRIEIDSVTLSPTVIDTTCVYHAPGNWGDPLNATTCRNHYPLIFAPHDLTILSGAGQGILVVNGDLHVAAGVWFRGAVLARGTVTAESGVVIEGGLRTHGDGTSALNGARVQLSRCALHTVLQAPALRRAVRARRLLLPTF